MIYYYGMLYIYYYSINKLYLSPNGTFNLHDATYFKIKKIAPPPKKNHPTTRLHIMTDNVRISIDTLQFNMP